MHVGHVVVHREDVFEIVLVWEDMNHPTEDHGKKGAPFGLASLFGMDGTEHAEFGVFAMVFADLVGRSAAEIGVLMPTRDAKRDPLVQLIFGCACADREH